MFKLRKYVSEFRTDILIILLVVFAISVANYVWLSYEKIPPHWDMGRHLWTSLLYLNMFHWDHFWHLWTDYYYYPPFRYWLTIPFYLVFGNSFTVAVMSNIVFILILAFSVYETGRMIWGRSTGLLAMFGILCSPMFVGQFKEYQLDAQLAAMVALSFCLLLKTEEFKDRNYSVYFGLSFGCGMLTKWTFVCCLLLPTAYAAVKGVWEGGTDRKNRIFNLLLATLFGTLVCFNWYWDHRQILKHDFSGNGVKPTDESLLSWSSISWYLRYFEIVQMYLVPTSLFFIGFLWSFFNRGWFEKNIYPFLLVMGCYFFLTLLHHDCRYTMPMLAGCFIYVVYWFEVFKHRWLRIGLKTIFVLYSCFTFCVISMGTNLFPSLVTIGPVILFDQYGYGVTAPDPTDWHQEEIFQIISKDKPENKVVGWLMPDHDDIRFNSWGNNYFAVKYDIAVKNPEEKPAYLIIRDFQKIDVDKYPDYEPYQQYVLPDKSSVCLFKRKGA